MDFKAKWIIAPEVPVDVVPSFKRAFSLKKTVKKAELFCTSLGVYEAFLNGKRVGEYVLAPGWTAYEKHVQYQKYDVTALLQADNEFIVNVARGWFSSPLGWAGNKDPRRINAPKAFLGELHITYEDGKEEILATDKKWSVGESAIRFSEIYDGETYDANFETTEWKPAKELKYTFGKLISQEGEEIRECERVSAEKVLVTPKGEILIDFGQEVTGYVEFTVKARKGQKVRILHSEVNDQDGNFYNENYRAAKAEINYTCKSGVQTYHPHLTFFGFRYIKLEKWPEKLEDIRPEAFTAIAVHSNFKRTGHVASSNPLLNRFFSNVFWGQRGNFLDVPTDCPQRDERLGWTGDAQAFSKTATYNFDVQKFFRKWLHTLADHQYPNGGVPHVIPDVLSERNGANEVKPGTCSSAWGDAACIVPWQVYMTYGDAKVLKDQFASMKEWIRYITETTKDEFLWTGGTHYGDWLGLDAPVGSYKGSSREDFIASAFYLYSTSLVVKAGKVIGKDVKYYEELQANILQKFREAYPTYNTQTESVLALFLGITENPSETAAALVQKVKTAGRMETGFVGTPYLLHVLSDHGYQDLAWKLLLREEYPGWLYPVLKGATTVWEHWDGIMVDGGFWSKAMNSFNHYAYGSVLDWVYEKAAGIQPMLPGFEEVKVAPLPTDELEWLEASIDTRNGLVSSKWAHVDGKIRYDITLPTAGEVVINGESRKLPKGEYTFWG